MFAALAAPRQGGQRAQREAALRGSIAGTGAAVPTRIVTNDYFVSELGLDTTAEWIESRTGIRERRFADPDLPLHMLAANAGRQALERAGADPADLRLIVVATSSSDNRMPSTAALVQAELCARRAAAFDLNAACSGFVYAFDVAARCLQSLGGQALIIGADRGSSLVNRMDRTTSVFFGDAAGAVLLDADGPGEVLASALASQGTAAPLVVPAHGTMHMDGKAIWNFATQIIPETILSLCRTAGLSPDEIDLIVPHQANVNILKAAADALDMPFDRWMVNLDRYGNTVAASVPVALDEALQSGRARRGDHVLLVGFGAGLCWGGQIIQL
ncbi:MAG: beta-ketoacyl-ACP synthase 3 [Planctomycetaceae bacterium]|nr:beta-ketoacyl-ACP synthase 3 [Planctomycetaceae bacterium]